jgi:peptidoglycan/LPS O-acetylase OafA/YrhL
VNRTQPWRWLKRVARTASFSYTLYIVHLPVLLAIWAIGRGYRLNSIQLLVLSAIAILLVISVALPLARIFERHREFAALIQIGLRSVGSHARRQQHRRAVDQLQLAWRQRHWQATPFTER